MAEDEHMKRVRAIQEAFNGLNTNKWVAGDAALADVPIGPHGGEATGALVEVRRLATEAGVDFDALRNYRNVAGAWPVATRVATVSWSVHRELMGHPDRFQIVRDNPNITVNDARKLRGAQPANYAKPATRSNDPEEWTLEQWDDFDREVVKASRTVLLAFTVRHAGLYTPSVEATAQLSLLKQSDLDAELAALLKAAE